jgi:hypothetical protein
MTSKALSGVVMLSAGLVLAGAALGAQDATQAAPPVRQLELKFNNGLVTLKAQNVTVRDVLTEWARQCECQVIGAEKITNAPLTMPVQYINQPEAVIMKSLLNPGTGPGAVSGGYVFVPRNPGETGASAFQSIRIAAVSHPSAVAMSPQPTGAFAAPLMTNDDELPPVQKVNVPLEDPAKSQQPAQPPQPAPIVPPSVMPTTGVNGSTGRTGGPGQPTAPPTVPPGTTGRGGGG